jgi:hypothetical protein
MADKKISELATAATPVDTDLLEVLQPAQTPKSRKLTFQALKSWIVVTFGLLPNVKVYRALLTQAGTNDPVATVFENTLGGNIVWQRDSNGYYHGSLNNAFPANKTFIMLNNHMDTWMSGSPTYAAVAVYGGVSTIGIITGTAGEDSEYDDILNNFIEIRVYP